MNSALKEYESSKKSAEKFIVLIDKYQNFDELTRAMINEFVEKILVHERAEKGRQNTTQEVEVFFNFVGKYVPPHFREQKPLTPEELEEIEKKKALRKRFRNN